MADKNQIPQETEMFISRCFDDALDNGCFDSALRIMELFRPEGFSENQLSQVRELIMKTSDNLRILEKADLSGKDKKSEQGFHYLLAMLDDDCDFYSFSRIKEMVQSCKPSAETAKKLLLSIREKIKQKERDFQSYENISSHIKNRDFKKAVDECRKILKTSPDDREALLFLYRGKGSIKRINQISTLLKDDNTFRDFSLVIYNLMYLLRYISEDSDSYRKIIDLMDVFVSGKKKKFKLDELIKKGYEAIEKGDIESATRMASRAIELDEESHAAKELLNSLQTVNNFEALLARGKSLFYKGEFANALAIFKQCVEITGKTEDLQDFIQKIETRLQVEDLYNKAVLFYKKEDWRNAIDHFNRILKKDREYKKVSKLMETAEKRLELEELSQKLENAISINDAEYSKSLIARMKKIDPDYRGIALLEERLNASDSFNNLIKKASDELTAKNFSTARQSLEQALDIDPTHNRALKLYKRLEEEEKIAEILERALNAFSEEKYDEILSLCRKGLLIQPDNKELRQLNDTAKEQSRSREKLFEAKALLAKDRFGDANKILTGILGADPDNKEADELLKRVEKKILLNTLLTKGLNSLQKKDLEGARIIFNEALKIEPDNKKIKEYLSKIDSVIKVEDKNKLEITKVTRVPVESTRNKIIELMQNKEFDMALACVQTALEDHPEDEKLLAQKAKLQQIIERLDELENEAIMSFQSGDYNSSLIKWKTLLSNVNSRSSRYHTLQLQFQGVLETMSNELIQRAESHIAAGNMEKAKNTITVLSKLPLEGISEKAKELSRALK